MSLRSETCSVTNLFSSSTASAPITRQVICVAEAGAHFPCRLGFVFVCQHSFRLRVLSKAAMLLIEQSIGSFALYPCTPRQSPRRRTDVRRLMTSVAPTRPDREAGFLVSRNFERSVGPVYNSTLSAVAGLLLPPFTPFLVLPISKPLVFNLRS